MLPRNSSFTIIENKLPVLYAKTGVSAYDFEFFPYFLKDFPREFQGDIPCVARVGAISDYRSLFEYVKELTGLSLVNSNDEHLRASELEYWYPLIEKFTPFSKVYDAFPSSEELEKDFNYPVFIKGNRQTSKHNPKLSIARNRIELKEIEKAYSEDTILHWQKVVVREFIELFPLGKSVENKVQLSYEFRSFWWYGKCVGIGHYWSEFATYEINETEREEVMPMLQEAASILSIPFLVIDFAKTQAGNWIIIECNDAQESGYVGVDRVELWREILRYIT